MLPLLVACSDTALHPLKDRADDDSASDDSPADTAAGDSAATDSGGCSIDAVAPTRADGDATCLAETLSPASAALIEVEYVIEGESGFGDSVSVSSMVTGVTADGHPMLLVLANGLPGGRLFAFAPGEGRALLAEHKLSLSNLAWARPDGSTSDGPVFLESYDTDGLPQLLCLDLDSGGLLEAGSVEATNSAMVIADLDLDGRLDPILSGVAHDADCSAEWSVEDGGFSATLPLFWWFVSGEPAVATRLGYGYASGLFTPWNFEAFDPISWTQPLAGTVVNDRGELGVLAAGNRGACRLASDGLAQWCYDDPALAEGDHSSSPPAIIDVNDDGVPELFFRSTEGSIALRADGSVLWGPLDEIGGRGGIQQGGVVATDVNADGAPEIIDQHELGVELRDGGTGAILAAFDDLAAFGDDLGPLVADIDGDGSLEIVVAGRRATDPETVARVVVIGPSEGRWARGRPVWHQRAYDITSIRDDGTIVSFPEPSWLHYNSFRYQPPHDGPYPDLVPVLVETCAESCDTTEGYVQLAVAAENLGSVAAMEGAQLVVYAHTASDGLRELDRATLGETIEPSMRSSSVVFTLDSSDWGDRRVIEVVPAHDDECDWVNNRIEPWDDPCAAP